MEKSQVRETVDSMEMEDRAYLEAYLKVKHLVEDESFKKESADRLKAMKAGDAISSQGLKELNQTLSDKGL